MKDYPEELKDFAIDEMQKAGLTGEGSLSGLMHVFFRQCYMKGTNKETALAAAIFIRKILDGELLSPLTQDPGEWETIFDCEEVPLYLANRRCPRVICQDGVYTDLEAFLYTDEDGTTYVAGTRSAVEVTLPYLPVQKVVPFGQD